MAELVAAVNIATMVMAARTPTAKRLGSKLARSASSVSSSSTSSRLSSLKRSFRMSSRSSKMTEETQSTAATETQNQFQVGNTAETCAPVALRRDEALESDYMYELKIGTTVEVIEVGEGRRLKIRTYADEGWISYKTKADEALIVAVRDQEPLSDFEVGEHFKVESPVVVRLGESLDTQEIGELQIGDICRIVQIGTYCKRRARVETIVDAPKHLDGWISLVTKDGEQLVSKEPGISRIGSERSERSEAILDHQLENPFEYKVSAYELSRARRQQNAAVCEIAKTDTELMQSELRLGASRRSRSTFAAMSATTGSRRSKSTFAAMSATTTEESAPILLEESPTLPLESATLESAMPTSVSTDSENASTVPSHLECPQGPPRAFTKKKPKTKAKARAKVKKTSVSKELEEKLEDRISRLRQDLAATELSLKIARESSFPVEELENSVGFAEGGAADAQVIEASRVYSETLHVHGHTDKNLVMS